MSLTFEQLTWVLLGCLAGQIVMPLWIILFFARAGKKQRTLEREMYGLMKKLEGLTETSREKMMKHYDQMLGELETRLPTAVAANASELIFDTESKILKRLAEIEPELHANAEGKKKLNELIVTMETLEDTIVTTASDAVRKVITESRNALVEIDPGIAKH